MPLRKVQLSFDMRFVRAITRRTIYIQTSGRLQKSKAKTKIYLRSTDVHNQSRIQTAIPRAILRSSRATVAGNLSEPLSEIIRDSGIRQAKSDVISGSPRELVPAFPPKTVDVPSQSKSSIFNPESSSLFTPAPDIPQVFKDILGPTVKYLVKKDNQNWNVALNEIEKSGGFKYVSELDVRKLVYSIPRSQIVAVFPQIERLLRLASLPKSPKIINAYLKGLIVGGTLDEACLELMERYVNEMKHSSKKKVLSRETYEILIEAYGKSHRIEKMERMIDEMKANGLQPSMKVYSSVLNTCVYKTKDHRQAVQLFDLMKFLSGSINPGTVQYQDIIVSYVNDDDIEKALDLYEEMQTKNIPSNQRIYVALAKGCLKRKLLRLQAWNFIFEIYKQEWDPTVPTLEYMIFLAAQDKDLPLARALYHQLNLLNATSPRSFSFLMRAYARGEINKTLDGPHIPAVSLHELGRNFRQNILDKSDYSTPRSVDLKQSVPFLPTIALTNNEEILSESSAIMTHAIIYNIELVSKGSVDMFLEVLAKIGSLEEFIDGYNRFSYCNDSGVPLTRTATSDTKLASSYRSENNVEEMVASETRSPILSSSNDKMPEFKVSRTTKTYCIALRAAAKHKNYPFLQAVWQERGTYRRSSVFRSKSASEKKESDFEFATSMVNCLASMLLLDDALAVLMSTENQFKWTWRELHTLHTTAVNLGHDKALRIIRGIANRAQVNYEGKISSKTFKEYAISR